MLSFNESLKILKETNALLEGHFILSSGLHSNQYVQCAKLLSHPKQGQIICKSLCEKNLSSHALSILKKAKKFNCEIILPVDAVCADNLNDQLNIRKCNIKDIYSKQMILDLGINTTEIIKKYILKSSMIIWNGPLGAFEYKPFDQSSNDVAKIICKQAKLLDD